MRYRTKDLWSQLSTAQEHHTVVRAETLPEPVCMQVYVDWKGVFCCYCSKCFTKTKQSNRVLQNLFHDAEGTTGLEIGPFWGA